MELTTLADIQEAAAYIFNSWTLGLREAQMMGRNAYFDNFKDAYRVHYLFARINAAYVKDDKIYIGNEETDLSSISSSYFDLWHYRGTWTMSGLFGSSNDTESITDVVDTENGGIVSKPPPTGGTEDSPDQGGDVTIPVIPDVTSDDGSGDSNTGEGGDAPSGSTVTYNLSLRAGSQAVSIGANVITFYVNGVATPFESEVGADYILDSYVLTNSGRKQSNLVVSQYLASGFVVDDILEAGVLYYQAIPRT